MVLLAVFALQFFRSIQQNKLKLHEATERSAARNNQTEGEIVYIKYNRYIVLSYTFKYEVSGKLYTKTEETPKEDRDNKINFRLTCAKEIWQQDTFVRFDASQCLGKKYLIWYNDKDPEDALLDWTIPLR